MHKLLVTLLFLASTPVQATTYVYASAGGVTYHGTGTNQELADQMPNRITNDGRFVFHPVAYGLNVISDDVHVSLEYLRDCFNMPAYLVAVGKQFRLGQNWRYGFLAGIYERQRYYFVAKNGFLSTAEDLPYSFDYNGMEVEPTVFLDVSYLYPVFSASGLAVNVASNYYLNHLQVSWWYRF